MTLPDRFWRKVNKTASCWLWTASRCYGGYGRFRVKTRVRQAHRLAYEALVGEIPNGLQLDHLCRVRNCVNPAHLEPVTGPENVRRGDSGLARGEQLRNITHCPQGHPYSGDNLYFIRTKDRTNRRCRECGRKAWRSFYARNVETERERARRYKANKREERRANATSR